MIGKEPLIPYLGRDIKDGDFVLVQMGSNVP